MTTETTVEIVVAHPSIDLRARAPEAYRALAGVDRALAASSLGSALRELPSCAPPS